MLSSPILAPGHLKQLVSKQTIVYNRCRACSAFCAVLRRGSKQSFPQGRYTKTSHACVRADFFTTRIPPRFVSPGHNGRRQMMCSTSQGPASAHDSSWKSSIPNVYRHGLFWSVQMRILVWIDHHTARASCTSAQKDQWKSDVGRFPSSVVPEWSRI